jgi:hypothetical protein
LAVGTDYRKAAGFGPLSMVVSRRLLWIKEGGRLGAIYRLGLPHLQT